MHSTAAIGLERSIVGWQNTAAAAYRSSPATGAPMSLARCSIASTCCTKGGFHSSLPSSVMRRRYGAGWPSAMRKAPHCVDSFPQQYSTRLQLAKANDEREKDLTWPQGHGMISLQ